MFVVACPIDEAEDFGAGVVGQLAEQDLAVAVGVGLAAKALDDEVEENAVLQVVVLVGDLPLRATERRRHAAGGTLLQRAGHAHQVHHRADGATRVSGSLRQASTSNSLKPAFDRRSWS